MGDLINAEVINGKDGHCYLLRTDGLVFIGTDYHNVATKLPGSEVSKTLSPTRSWAVYKHSPDGFSWGYGGSGPAQLALAILLEVGLRPEDAEKLHQRFKWDVIAPLKQDSFTLTTTDVRDWIQSNG